MDESTADKQKNTPPFTQPGQPQYTASPPFIKSEPKPSETENQPEPPSPTDDTLLSLRSYAPSKTQFETSDPPARPIPTPVEVIADEEQPIEETSWGGLLSVEPEAEKLPSDRNGLGKNSKAKQLVIASGLMAIIATVAVFVAIFAKPVAEAVSAMPTEPEFVLPAITLTPQDSPPPSPQPSSTPRPLPTSTVAPSLGIGSTLLSPKDNAVMVYVPAGEFMMGSDKYVGSESPSHSIYLDAFWIDQTEVTNAMYALFLTEMGNQIEDSVRWFNEGRIEETREAWTVLEGYEDYPVIFVTWYGARAYCDWAGKRLPTEAEWEKAARGDDERLYPWGDQTPDCKIAQLTGCGERELPVGSYPDNASPFGALDMAGNVWEWVLDFYDQRYYQNSPTDNPTGPETGTWRIMRGGSWNAPALELRTTVRLKVSIPWGGYDSGFRCAMDALGD